jgi:hypothetical protein
MPVPATPRLGRHHRAAERRLPAHRSGTGGPATPVLPSRPREQVLVGFEDFTARLLEWVSWWNTEHRPRG